MSPGDSVGCSRAPSARRGMRERSPTAAIRVGGWHEPEGTILPSATPASSMTPLALQVDGPFGGSTVFMHNELVLSGEASGAHDVEEVRVEVDGRVYHAAHGLPRTGRAARGSTSAWTPGAGRPAAAPRGGDVAGRLGRRGGPEGRGRRSAVRPARVQRRGTSAAIAAGRRPCGARRPGSTAARSWWLRSGWRAGRGAHGDRGGRRLPGRRLHVRAQHGLPRPHLLETLGEPVAAGGGFAATIDPAECPPGWHTGHGRGGRARGARGGMGGTGGVPRRHRGRRGRRRAAGDHAHARRRPLRARGARGIQLRARAPRALPLGRTARPGRRVLDAGSGPGSAPRCWPVPAPPGPRAST